MQDYSALPKKHAPLLGAVVIVLLLFLTVIAINPIHNFPVEDDWDYSRMVKILIDTGRIERSDYAQATLIFPALYGGLVSKLFGFSFTNLRLSTLVLALVALLAFYSLLGELGFNVPRRVMGTLALLFTPIFIYLAFSFMTDVPALCWLTVGILFYVRAFRRGTALDALLGSASAALAFLTRQTGIFLPVTFGAIVLFRLPRNTWLKFLAAGVLPSAAVIGLYLLLNREGTTNWATQNITFGLTVEQMLQPDWWGIFLRRAVQTLMTVSLYLAPLFAALVFGINRQTFRLPHMSRPNLLRTAGIGVLAVVIGITIARLASRGEWFPYLTDILTRAGMRPYLAYIAWDAHAIRPDFFPSWLYGALTFIAAILGIILVGIILSRVHLNVLRRTLPELQFIWLLTVFIALASLIFATFYERYLLPLLLAAIILLLDASRRIGFSWRAAALTMTIMAVGIWFLMQDYWGLNEVRWQLGRELLAQNTPVNQIDGGYEWDGWYLYDATVEYIRVTGKPFIYDPWSYVLDPVYAMSFGQIPNYRIERTMQFPTPFSSNQFYLLRRQ